MIRILLILHLWMFSLCTYAWSWKDLWQTKDQQGAQAMREGNPEKAAKAFQSPEWRGVANYRSNNFEGAAADFANLNTDVSHYNRGNALAKSQQFQEALNEYEQALKLNPNFSDAKANRDIVKKLLEKQPKQNPSQDSKKQSSSNSNEQQGASQSSDPQKNSSSHSNQQQASSESKASQKNNTQNTPQNNSSQQENMDSSSSDRSLDKDQKFRSSQNEEKNNQQNTSGMGNQSLNQNLSNKLDEKDQQWLQKIPDDPGGLLRRKFIRDYEREQQGESS